MHKIELDQRSDEWLNYRKEKIGGSDVPSILGISPYKTPYELYLEKVYGISKAVGSAARMGIEKEEEARLFACEELKLNFIPIVAESEKFPYLIASMDGFCEKGQGTGIEIKWNRRDYHESAKLGKIIDHHNAQIQTQYLVTEASLIYYVSCWQDEKIAIPVKRDEDLIQEIIVQSEIFYREHMMKKVAPQLSDKDYEEIVDFEGGITEAWKRLIDTQKQIKVLEENEDILKQIIINSMGERNSKIGPYKLTKFEKKGAIDYKAIPELKNVDLELYRKEGSWQYRFSSS